MASKIVDWKKVSLSSNEVFSWISTNKKKFPVCEIFNPDYVPSAILDPLCPLKGETSIAPCALWLLSSLIEINFSDIKFDPIIQIQDLYDMYCEGLSVEEIKQKFISHWSQQKQQNQPKINSNKQQPPPTCQIKQIHKEKNAPNYQTVIAKPSCTFQSSKKLKTLGDFLIIKKR